MAFTTKLMVIGTLVELVSVKEGIVLELVPLVTVNPLIPVGTDGILQLKVVFGVGEEMVTELVVEFEQTACGVG